MPAAISVKNITKQFGSVRALAGVTFQVEKGAIFGFLGPNGAGKTTTIRCLMDFIRPDGGHLSLLGKAAYADSVALKRSIGYLPAGNNLYNRWTVWQHIDFAARLRGLAPDRDMLKRLNLDDHRRVGSLSTGNRQKLMIALALLGQPELLILDEPTKGLDPILQSQLYEILSEHRQRGGTVFMSSHNLPEVEKICDSVAVIKAGRIIVEETLESLRHKSLHHVSVLFRSNVDPRTFRLPGVEILRHAPRALDLKVRGDLTPTMHLIGRQPILDLEVTHASLEELFLEMYE